jgi:NhaA family Na+:H+ antiporter
MAFLQSGVHATIAGVLLAMCIPVRTRIDTREFLDEGRRLLDEFDRAGVEGRNVLTNPGQQAVIQALEDACEHAQAPLQRMEHDLQRWVAFLIVPLFALSNAGLRLSGDLVELFQRPVTMGVMAGLLLGKPLGITLFSWASVRLGLAARPAGVPWRAIHGVSWLGGIGFTMSLFVGDLAFGEGSVLLNEAKIGILAGSFLAVVIGWLLIRGSAEKLEEPFRLDASGHAVRVQASPHLQP